MYENLGNLNNKPLVWGSEDAQYGTLTTSFDNDCGDRIKFLEYFATSFTEKLFDFGYFMTQKSRVNLIIDIAKGKMSGFNEDEMLEVAEFIKNGWVKKDGDALYVCVPVYADAQYKQAVSLTDAVTDRIAETTRELISICTEIMMQYTPVSKKKDAKEIVWLTYGMAMGGSVEIMQSSGVLRRTFDNEHPTTYIVLK